MKNIKIITSLVDHDILEKYGHLFVDTTTVKIINRKRGGINVDL